MIGKQNELERDGRDIGMKLICFLFFLALITPVGSNCYKNETVTWTEIIKEISENCTDELRLENKLINGDLNFSNLDLPREYADLTDYERDRDIDRRTKLKISFPIIINNSAVNGKLDFRDILFENSISIINTRMKEANFFGAVFKGPAKFSGSSFNGNSEFLATRFSIDANFENVTFNKPTDFDGSEIFVAHFKDATFNSSADFKSCKIYKSDFKSKFLGPADFSGASFLDYASFVNSYFNNSASFKQANFLKDAHFRYSIFKGPAQFIGANFSKDPKFDYATFNDIGDFSDVNVNKLSFENAKMDNFYSNWYIAKNKLKLDNDYRTIRIYEALREQYIKSFMRDDANDCYYETMKIKAHLADDSISFFLIDRGQRYLYGYGVKPHYPLILSACIIIIFWLLFRLIGIKKALLFSYNIFLSGTGKLLVDAPDLPKDSSDLAMLLYNIERFFGLLLFSLFIIALTKSVS